MALDNSLLSALTGSSRALRRAEGAVRLRELPWRKLRVAMLSMVVLAPRAVDAQRPTLASFASATDTRPLEIELRTVDLAWVPGRTTSVALRLTPNAGWHTYWKYAGDVGSAPGIAWQLPSRFRASALRWPAPSLIASPPLASYGYEREVHLVTDITVPANVPIGSRVTLTGDVTWVACKVECIAGDVRLALTLPVSAVAAVDTAVQRVVRDERAREPRVNGGWKVVATIDSTHLSLHVASTTGSGPPSRDAHFFVDSAGLIDHAAPQSMHAESGATVLRMRRSDYAGATPTHIRGVIVTRDSAVDVVAPVVTTATTGMAVGDSGSLVGLIGALALALLGGTLLNFMPCVLPILSIKTLRLADATAQSPSAVRRHVLVFGAGVLVSLWTLVALLLVLRSAGASVGWGYQLQSPAVVGAISLLVLAAALNLAGVFELAPIGGRLVSGPPRAAGDAQAFGEGALVVALATPCSAPFLGSAVAYGVTHRALDAVLVFTAMGLGLVWPFAAAALSPRARAWLPKPGAWMVTLRQGLVFPLLLTVVWLVWVHNRQAGSDATAQLLVGMVLLAFAAWYVGRFGTVDASAGRRWRARVIAGTAGVAALALALRAETAPTLPGAAAKDTTDLVWTPYSRALLDSARTWGRPVLLDVTADWCLTCKVNDRVAFGVAAVHDAIREHEVLLVRADWTTRDSTVTALLASLNRHSVPLVVMYGADPSRSPEFLPTLLTPGRVIDAIKAAVSLAPIAAAPTPSLPSNQP